ncbi:MAG: hypothetical protein ACO1TE_09580 [Prosthecobacter sp.]
MNTFLRLLAGGCLTLMLSQCVWSNTDSGYFTLFDARDYNPSPHAIVGMWHRQDKRFSHDGSTMSLLFKRDGTMHVIGQSVLLRGGLVETKEREVYRYQYFGGGGWVVPGTKIIITISQGKLLFSMPFIEGFDYFNYIFQRQ